LEAHLASKPFNGQTADENKPVP